MDATNILLAIATLVLGGFAVAIVAGDFRLRLPRPGGRRLLKAELRQRAPYDRGAAKELRRELLGELRHQQAVRRDIESDRGTAEDRAGLLRDLERAEQVTRDELAGVETWLRQRR